MNMAIDKINLNNRIIEPDAQGMADLSTLITAHQDLSEYQKLDRMVFVTAEQWAGISATALPDVFYFVGQ